MFIDVSVQRGKLIGVEPERFHSILEAVGPSIAKMLSTDEPHCQIRQDNTGPIQVHYEQDILPSNVGVWFKVVCSSSTTRLKNKDQIRKCAGDFLSRVLKVFFEPKSIAVSIILVNAEDTEVF